MDNLQAEFGIPEAVSITDGINGLPKVVLTHQSGSSAEVHLHGAHITSWKNASGEELFFVSRESNFALGKPIRGGIPVCFPQFSGQGPLPQHGIARTSEWRLIQTNLLDNGTVAAELQLAESPETLAIWPHRFTIALCVLLDENTLSALVQVANTDDSTFSFQIALHTYFGVADIRQTSVNGLEGITFIDSLRDKIQEVESRPVIRFAEETDRIYVNAPDSLRVGDEGHGRSIGIEKRNLPDAVVWNPWIAKSQKMADFGDDEYINMVCVETGCIASHVELSPGGQWLGETTFTVREELA